MARLSDRELIRELEARFEENRQALHDLRMTTGKLEELNRKLQEAEALKSHFLSNVRNEINNPLTAIAGLARQMMDGKIAADELEDVAADIYFEAFSLDFHLQNIFAAAELEAGEALVSPSRTRVDTLFTNTTELFYHQATAKKIEVRLDLPRTAAPFVTDPGKLRIILANLLGNAVEFSPPGAVVEVKVKVADDRLVTSVVNHGIVLNEAARQVIFDRFRQLESGSTKRHRGQGLGLSVCRALAELLGGEIGVTADERERWCRFELTLPSLDERGADTANDSNVFLFEEAQKF